VAGKVVARVLLHLQEVHETARLIRQSVLGQTVVVGGWEHVILARLLVLHPAHVRALPVHAGELGEETVGFGNKRRLLAIAARTVTPAELLHRQGRLLLGLLGMLILLLRSLMLLACGKVLHVGGLLLVLVDHELVAQEWVHVEGLRAEGWQRVRVE